MRTLFGLSLKPQALSLLEEVEHLFGKRVNERRQGRDFVGPQRAASSVSAKGAPVIDIAPAIKPTEETIVHELFHLKQMAEGFWVIKGIIPVTWQLPDPDFGNDFSPIMTAIREAVAHYGFYPEMVRMGYDPTVNEKGAVEQLVQRADIPPAYNVSARRRNEVYAAEFLYCGLVLDGTPSVSRLEKWYTERRLVWSLERGRQLVRLAKAARPLPPKDEMEVAVGCLNALFQGVVRFELQEEGEVKSGVSTQHNVVLLAFN